MRVISTEPRINIMDFPSAMGTTPSLQLKLNFN